MRQRSPKSGISLFGLSLCTALGKNSRMGPVWASFLGTSQSGSGLKPLTGTVDLGYFQKNPGFWVLDTG
ncbi:hypothetical protein, partial [Acinetobacter baumannii]|uniref:hypothetical protein n=1 Tax=Acinetobacter baumannii TaxID=470 RepID=UPI001BB465C7